MNRPTLRTLLGLVSLAGLAGLGLWIQAGRADRWPGVVVPEASFQLSGVEPGRYTWALEDGRVPRGHGLVAQRAVVFERNDQVSLEIAAGLQNGAMVVKGQKLATLRSTFLEEQVHVLEAERAVLQASRDLLVAGARPEAVASAQKALQVARAQAEGARPDRARAEKLVASGVGSAAELESAALLERVRALEADLAAAHLAELKASARIEELSAIDAELSSVTAQLALVQQRIADGELSAPIEGVLSLGQVLESNGETTVLRVQDIDPVVLRVALPQNSRPDLRVGQRLKFETRAVPDRKFDAEVLAISDEAVPLNGQQIFWVAATVDNSDGQLWPGVSGWASFPGKAP